MIDAANMHEKVDEAEKIKEFGSHLKLSTYDIILTDRLFNTCGEDFVEDTVKIEYKYLIKDVSKDQWKLNPEFDKEIPKNSRGVYFFVIRPKEFLDMCIPAYIGRALHYTDKKYDLKSRIKTYESNYRCKYRNRRLYLDDLFLACPEHLYLQVYIFPDMDEKKANDLVERYEANLVSSIIPPFNKEIHVKDIREAVNAYV